MRRRPPPPASIPATAVRPSPVLPTGCLLLSVSSGIGGHGHPARPSPSAARECGSSLFSLLPSLVPNLGHDPHLIYLPLPRETCSKFKSCYNALWPIPDLTLSEQSSGPPLYQSGPAHLPPKQSPQTHTHIFIEDQDRAPRRTPPVKQADLGQLTETSAEPHGTTSMPMHVSSSVQRSQPPLTEEGAKGARRDMTFPRSHL